MMPRHHPKQADGIGAAIPPAQTKLAAGLGFDTSKPSQVRAHRISIGLISRQRLCNSP